MTNDSSRDNRVTINILISVLVIISAILVAGMLINEYYEYNTTESVNARALNPPMDIDEIREIPYNINYIIGIINIYGIEVIHTKNPGTYKITVNTNNRDDQIQMLYSTHWQYFRDDRFGGYYDAASESNRLFYEPCITMSQSICVKHIILPDKLNPSMKIKLRGHGSGNISVQRLE